jgi:hypothetical protein
MAIMDRPAASTITPSRPPRHGAGRLGAGAAAAVVLLFALAFLSLAHRGGGAHFPSSARSTPTAPPTSGWDAAYLGADGHLHLATPDGAHDAAGPVLPDTRFITYPFIGWTDAVASPGGRFVAYAQGSDPNSGSAVAIVAVATGKIITVPTPCTNLYWSPDGTRLAADSSTNSTAGNRMGVVGIIDVASGKVTNLSGMYQGQPAQVYRAIGWIDGAHLAVLSSVPGPAARAPSDATGQVRARPLSSFTNLTLAALDVASGALRPVRALTTDADPFPPNVYLAPDGKEALFASSTFQPTAQVIDIATGAVRPLPHVTAAFAGKFVFLGGIDFEGANWANFMAWRPGGHTLALSLAAFGLGVEGTTHQDSGVWLVDLDGDTARRLTANSYPLAWLPNGRTLLTSGLPPESVGYGGRSVGPTLTAVDAAAPTAPGVVLSHQMAVFFGLVRAP